MEFDSGRQEWMDGLENILESDPETFLDIVFNRIALEEGDPAENLLRIAMDLARQEGLNLLRVINRNQAYIENQADDILEFSDDAVEKIDQVAGE